MLIYESPAFLLCEHDCYLQYLNTLPPNFTRPLSLIHHHDIRNLCPSFFTSKFAQNIYCYHQHIYSNFPTTLTVSESSAWRKTNGHFSLMRSLPPIVNNPGECLNINPRLLWTWVGHGPWNKLSISATTANPIVGTHLEQIPRTITVRSCKEQSFDFLLLDITDFVW
jgi:hypothetical protein